MSIRETPCPFGTTGSLEKAPHPTSNSAAQRGDYCIWLGTSHSITGAHPDSTLRRDVMSWEISQLTNFLPFRLHPSLSSSLSPPSLPPTPSLSRLFPSPSSLSSLYFAIPSLTSPSLSFYTLALPLFPSSPPFSFLFSFPIPPFPSLSPLSYHRMSLVSRNGCQITCCPSHKDSYLCSVS